MRDIECFEHEVDAIPVKIFRVNVVNKSYKTFVIYFSSFSFGISNFFLFATSSELC